MMVDDDDEPAEGNSADSPLDESDPMTEKVDAQVMEEFEASMTEDSKANAKSTDVQAGGDKAVLLPIEEDPCVHSIMKKLFRFEKHVQLQRKSTLSDLKA